MDSRFLIFLLLNEKLILVVDYGHYIGIWLGGVSDPYEFRVDEFFRHILI